MFELKGLRKTRKSDHATDSSRRLSSSNGGLDPAIADASTNPAGTLGTPRTRQSRASISSDNPSVGPVRRVTSTASLRNDNSSSRQVEKRSSIGSVRSGSAATSDEKEPRHIRTSQSKANMASSQQASLPPVPTAASVARDHFLKELEIHQHSNSLSQTLVVLQDACYGHRFSRPRSTQQTLDFVFERPERLRATALGIATAYVRMGGRSSAGNCQPSLDTDMSTIPLPPFMFRRTTRTVPLSSAAVTHVHGKKWMSQLKAMCDDAEARLALNGSELVRPSTSSSTKSDRTSESHTSPSPLNEGDLYLCPESLHAFEAALGGVCEGVDSVFSPETSIRRAFVPIRPPGHHCSSDHPSGFCWLNNVHVGIAHAAIYHGLTHAAIIDFDLHHGDGSQELAWQQNRSAMLAAKKDAPEKKTKIGYFSLHDINSFPCEEGNFEKVSSASMCLDNAHGQSIWNVHLEPFDTPSEFWDIYRAKYVVLLERARRFLEAHTEHLASNQSNPIAPKAAIFISAGFDGSEYEGTGMQRHTVNVPTDFYAQFTSDIVKIAEEEGLGVDGRVISILEGGYSDRALTTGVTSHLCGLCGGEDITGRQSDTTGDTADGQVSQNAYDHQWWSPSNINELEAAIGSPETKVRPILKLQKAAPTYFSPTQASVAKSTVQPVRDPRLSNTPQFIDITPMPSLHVGWATASLELSKLFIPNDRSTRSLEFNDLKNSHKDAVVANANNAATNGTGGHMQLRERRPKASQKPPPLRSAKSRPILVTPKESPASPTTVGSESPPLSPSLRPDSAAMSANGREPLKARNSTVRHKTSKEQTLRTSASRSQLRPDPNNRRPGSTPDIENLTSGVRRLKLIVPSPEEYSAREAARKTSNPQKANNSTSTLKPIADDASSSDNRIKERPVTPGKLPPQTPGIDDADGSHENSHGQGSSNGMQSSFAKSSSPSPPDKRVITRSPKSPHQTRRNDQPNAQAHTQPSASPSLSFSGTCSSTSSSKRLSVTSTTASPPLSPHSLAHGTQMRRNSQA